MMLGQIIISISVLGISGLFFAVLLAFLSKKLKVEEDPKVARILEALPGINCGACGFSGCRAYAEEAAAKNDIFNGCLPGGEEVNSQVCSILGIDSSPAAVKRIVVCRCGAAWDEKKHSSAYDGPATCKAADILKGAIDCRWGCLGFGDCVEICPVGALSREEAKIRVDREKCIGCGKCVAACPRGLFEMVDSDKADYYVACSNKDKALDVKKVCARGCIGCGICVRVENSPFELKNNLSYLKYSEIKELTSLETARQKCPTKCIFRVETKLSSELKKSD